MIHLFFVCPELRSPDRGLLSSHSVERSDWAVLHHPLLRRLTGAFTVFDSDSNPWSVTCGQGGSSDVLYYE